MIYETIGIWSDGVGDDGISLRGGDNSYTSFPSCTKMAINTSFILKCSHVLGPPSAVVVTPLLIGLVRHLRTKKVQDLDCSSRLLHTSHLTTVLRVRRHSVPRTGTSLPAPSFSNNNN